MKSLQNIYYKLREYSKQYYSLENEHHQISDEDYDNLLAEFEELYKSLDNPTPEQTKMYDEVVNGEFAGVDNNTERTLMLSIRKYKVGNTIYDFKKNITKIYNTVKKHQQNFSSNKIYYAPKFDGIALGFEQLSNGDYQVITRGGQDITDLIKQHKDYKYIVDKYSKTHKYLRGELVIDKTIFNAKYYGEYKNPRNCIVGVLKNNDVNDLSIVLCTDGINPLLENNQYIKSIDTIEQLYNLWSLYFNEYKNTKFPYQVDGIVLYRIASDVIIEQQQYPNNLFALKFPSESKFTFVEDIEWTLGKSGKYTPVLIVRPTEIDGSTITKVSAYNYDNLINIQSGVGARITISKSNDIIPKVDNVLNQSTDYRLPENYYIDGKHIFQKTSDNIVDNNKFVLSFKSLNIPNIGDTITSQLGNNVFNNNILEVFNIDHKVAVIEELGNTQISRFQSFSQIYDIKTLHLDKLIFMLQFDNCGVELSKKCALLITKQLTDTTGITKSVIKEVCQGNGFLKIQAAIAKLHNYGVKVIKPVDVNNDNIITYEMTGTPPNNRSKQDIIKHLSNTFNNTLIHTTLTKTTKLLITDNLQSNSSKMNKARKYGIKIVTYNDILLWKNIPSDLLCKN